MNKQRAYSLVHNHLKRGTLIRPNNCSRCGKEDTKAVDGRSIIHAHHHDYSKPLDVEWLCAKCHAKYETPHPVLGAPNYGEKNAISKLNNELVRYILTSKESGNSIAKRLGVNHSTVNRVRRGESWIAAAQGEHHD